MTDKKMSVEDIRKHNAELTKEIISAEKELSEMKKAIIPEPLQQATLAECNRKMFESRKPRPVQEDKPKKAKSKEA